MSETQSPYANPFQPQSDESIQPAGATVITGTGSFGIGQAFQNAWDAAAKNLGLVYGYAAVFMILLLAVVVVVTMVNLGLTFLMAGLGELINDEITKAIITQIPGQLLSIATNIVTTTISLGLLAFCIQLLRHHQYSVGSLPGFDTLFIGFTKIWLVAKVYLLQLLISLLLFLPAAILIGAYVGYLYSSGIDQNADLENMLRNLENPAVLIAIVSIAAVPTILAVMYIFIRIMFVQYAIIEFDQIKALDCYKHSWRLTQNWSTIGKIILLGLAEFFIAIAATLVVLLSCGLLLPLVMAWFALVHSDVYVQLNGTPVKTTADNSTFQTLEY
ncbi:MAG: hypothetical protein KDK39_05615 [Leptospiraceae bacterium]|nr:hypothetical protein [Leptospiraceae bacterium]